MVSAPPLRRRLITQALLPLVVMSVWILVLQGQISKLVDTAHWVDHTDQVLSGIQQLEAANYRHLAAVRGYALTSDAALLAPFYDRSAVEDGFHAIAALTADNPPQVARTRAAAGAYRKWRELAERELTDANARRPVAEVIRAGQRAQQELAAQLSAMREEENRLRVARTRQADRARSRTVLITTIAGAALAIFLALMAARSVAGVANAYERTARALRDEATKLATAEQQLRKDAEQLERRVKERTVELERANSQLEAFGYSVSHDLRAPLRGVQGLAQALVEDYGDRLDATGRAYATRVVDEAALMDTLIQDLLEYSRLTRADLDIHPVDLNDVLAAANHNVIGQALGASADIAIAPDLPVVRGNRSVLTQVFTNLLSNAIKFGGPHPSVIVWAERGESRVRVTVEDHGIGIDPAHHERIFRVFERLHGAESVPGTGIGLAIVRQGVERLGGRVGVQSAPGQGSRFWVELPSAEAAA